MLAIGVGVYLLTPTPPAEVVKQFPIGSKSSQLAELLKATSLELGGAEAWELMPESSATANLITTDVGSFRKTSSMDTNGAIARGAFTGRILLFEHRLTYSYGVDLYYLEGRLWKADWGFFPG